ALPHRGVPLRLGPVLQRDVRDDRHHGLSSSNPAGSSRRPGGATPRPPACDTERVPGERLSPPLAKRIPKVDVIHGDRRQDDYFWLRKREDPEAIAHLKAENA